MISSRMFESKHGQVQIIERETTLTAKVKLTNDFDPEAIEYKDIVPDITKLDQETVEVVDDFTPPDLYKVYTFKKI